MGNKAVNVKDYQFHSEDRLFFDANIWLFIHGPQEPVPGPGDFFESMNIYSSALRNIIKAESTIYVDVLVVSEFINRYARRKWDIHKQLGDIREKNRKNFKNFRNSPEFKPIAKEIADSTRRILENCTRIESGFEVLEIEDLIDEYKDRSSDFNDQVLRELCRNRGLKLVTHDIDFKDHEISILTANYRLLR